MFLNEFPFPNKDSDTAVTWFGTKERCRKNLSMQIRTVWPSVFGFEMKVGHILLFWPTLTTLFFSSLSNIVKNTWTHLKWYFHFYCLKLLRSKSDLIAGLLYTPLILSKAMQSLVINTRTGLITAKLFVTLHCLMQERGKRLHRLSHRIKPSQGFLYLSIIAFPAPSPTNMSWFSPVGCCSSQCTMPKQTPAFPQGDALVCWGWMFSCLGATALKTRTLPPVASKAWGKQGCHPS